MPKRVLSFCLVFLLIISDFVGVPLQIVHGTYATDLFISEYLEGSSNNKAIELFNGTGSRVNLGDYRVELYANGSSTATATYTPTGTLDSGDVFVIAHSSASQAIKDIADVQTTTVTVFNGDDAIVLKHNGIIIDSFGQVGYDPGTSWGSTGYETVDHTFVRKSTITVGDTDASDAFDPSVQWDVYAKDNIDDLGSHTMDGFSGAPSEDNTAPAITHTPVSMAIAGSDIVITAEIDDENTVTAAVYYGTTADGRGFTNELNMVNTSDNVYSATITNPSEGDLYYYIAATNSNGKTTTVPYDIESCNKITVTSVTAIAAARSAAVGTTVTVSGVVTFIDGSNYYIQDDTGGIDLYRGGLSLAVGDQVVATGPTVLFNGLLEISPANTAAVSLVSRGNELPEPRLITIPEINSSVESQLVKINNVTLGSVNTTGNTSVTDSSQNTINIYRIPTLTGIDTGDAVDIVAVVSKNNTDFQLRVLSASDIKLTSSPDTEAPVIVHTAVTAGNTNVDLVISASITDNRRITSAAIHYRTTGTTEYTVLNMTKGEGSTFSASIPKTELNTAGLQYYIEASDRTYTVTSPANTAVPYNVAISNDDIVGPEVTNLSPADGSSTESNLRPAISANYSDASGINSGSVRLLLDGIDITAAAVVAPSGITYTPPADLARIRHSVELSVSDTLGNVTTKSWAFSVGVVTYEPDGETGTAVQWSLSSADNFTQPIPATDGDFKAVSDLSCWFGASSPALSFSSGGASCSGWDNGANTKYWMIRTSTKSMANLKLSWRMRSSSTGPKDFKVQYSLNGGTWTDVPNSAIQVPYSSSSNSIGNSTNLFNVDLSNDVENLNTLYLRWLVTSNVSAGGGTVANGGTHQINNISITGGYMVGDNQVYAVTSSVPEGGVPLGSAVTFSSRTSGAVIKYSIDGGSTYETAENGQVTLTALPATLHVKAAKAGMEDSRVKIFKFTQAKVAAVSSSPQAGAIPSNAVITLTTIPADATIKYVLTKKAGTAEAIVLPEATYTTPIAMSEDMFPVNISAKATKETYLDSDTINFTYTAKKATGGEKNYFGQIHSHTTNSDGAGTLDEAFAWARDNAKLDFFAVTDHSNSFDTANKDDKAGTYNLGAYNSSNEKWQAGKRAAAEAAVPGQYVSFYGYEMTWSGGPGHINTYNTEGFVSRNNTELNNKTNDAGMRAYYALLKLHPESISQFNHPGTTFGNFSGFAYYDPVIDERITLIEVGNGEGAIGSGGYFPSYEQYDMALDKGWHLAPTNNQDNHKALWGNANTARTVVYTNDFTTEGIYQAMRDMRVYATEDANLDIVYTLNDEQLGTILDTVPSTAAFKVDAKNIAGNNKVKSIAIITNGGVEAYREDFGTTDAALDYVMESPRAGYYYIKVVQEDGRIAVTAPVWLGKADNVGISELTASTTTPVTTEEMDLTTEVFNNEDNAVTLNSVKYQIKGGDVIADNTLGTSIGTSSSVKHTQSFTPTEAKKTTIIVTVSIKVKGEDKTYTKEIELNVRDITKLKFIGIDASHLNEYVAGNYRDSMGNFSNIAMQYGLRTVTLNTSEGFIAAAADPRYQMFIITAPTRRLDPATGITHKTYSQAELDAIAAFAKQGKPVIITGWGDIYEDYKYVAPGLEIHMAGQQNKLLQAIGATLRIADDEAKDDANNGGQAPRLYLDDYNGKVSPLLKGLLEGQKFSHYGGATLYAINSDGTPALTLPNNVIPIISGHSTTYSDDCDKDGYGFADPTIRIPRYGNSPDAGKGAGKVLLTASETVDHGNGVTSQVIVSGGAFMSNFEIKNTSLDNPADAYSNELIVRNLLASIENINITPIADIKAAEEGTEFTIEGTATVSVYDGTSNNNTGFFDSIYVQDSTGGINLFPVADDVQAGQKIRVTGTLSSYQGEKQLAVSSIKILDKTIVPVTPTVVSTADAMAAANTGKLIKTTGVVARVVAEPNGTVNEITIDDGTGPAIVYINAYITPGKSLSFVTKGANISVIGLGSIGENFTSTTDFLPRIRVRDRGEIELAGAATYYTVKFDSDGGTTVADVTGIAPNTTITLPTAPTKSGYTFSGWFTGRNGSGTAFTAATVVTSNMTVYAKWLRNTSSNNDDRNDRDNGNSNTVTQPTTPSTTPTPSTSPGAAAKIEVTPSLNANGVAQATISAKEMDALIQQAVTTAGNIEIKAIAPAGAQAVSVAIPASAFQAIAGTDKTSVMIDTGMTTITFDEKAVAAISKAGAQGNVELSVAVVEPTTLSPEARAVVGTRPVYDFGITSDGKKVSGFEGGKALVNIPYTLQPGEDADAVILFHVTDDGKLEAIRCVYNTQTKCIEAVLNHFSVYAVAYNKMTFKDVPSNAWYAKATNFLAARGITSGVGNGSFGPSQKLTREQFLVMLMKAYNIAPDTKAVKSFDDVSNNYAAPYISAAKRLGISSGIGGNKFNPGKEISRQEMFVMLYNALKAIGELPAAKANLSINGYKDLSDVADWALPAMTLMVESGSCAGTGDNKLNPLSISDRATAAQIIYNLLK